MLATGPGDMFVCRGCFLLLPYSALYHGDSLILICSQLSTLTSSRRSLQNFGMSEPLPHSRVGNVSRPFVGALLF